MESYYRSKKSLQNDHKAWFYSGDIPSTQKEERHRLMCKRSCQIVNVPEAHFITLKIDENITTIILKANVICVSNML